MLRRRWSVIVITLIACSLSFTALAADRVTPSETTLNFKGLITEPQQRTLQIAVTGAPITAVEVVRHDLRDAASGAVIVGSALTVDPLKIEEVQDTASFAITLSGAKLAGHYTGTLDLRYADAGVTHTLAIVLDAVLESVPAVDTTTDSKSLTWFVESTANKSQPIFLKQTAVGDAEVEDATVLLMRDAKGTALPEGTVRAVAELPFTLAPAAARPITVVVQGDVPPGEYNGVLHVKVRNQPAAVEVPVKIKSKHGPLVPLIVLVAGLLASGALGWYNSEGRKKEELGKSLKAELEDAQAGRLQQDQLKAVIDLIELGIKSWNAGDSQTVIQAKLDAARQAKTAARAETDKLIAEVDQVIAEVQKEPAGDTARARIVDRLTAIRERALKGEWPTLAQARADKVDTDRDVKIFTGLLATYKALSDADKEKIKQDFNSAPTLSRMDEVLKTVTTAFSIDQYPRGQTFAVAAASAYVAARREELELSFPRRLALSLVGALVSVVAYVFALAVGYLTLYANNDVFGADLQNYLTLFLWGAVIESVRGKTITLTELQSSIGPKSGAAPVVPAAAPGAPKPPGG